ncbi:hypothetical protein BsWGS_07535 [Bradybaena similaris]
MRILACMVSVLFVTLALLTTAAEAAYKSGTSGRMNSPKSIVTSSYSVEKLASLNLTSNLKRYIDHEQFRLRVIKNFTGHEEEVQFVKKRLADFKVIHKSLLKNATANEQLVKSLKENHPTSILAAVRNFLAVWEDKLANETLYGKRLREFLEQNITSPLPTRTDYHLIGKSLTILQTSYNLSISDLIKGEVMGKKGEPLSQVDCYDMGKTVLQTGLLDTAYQWLEAAVKGYDLEKINASMLTFNLSDALATLGRLAFKKKDQRRALKLLEKANELDPDNLVLYQEYVKHRFGRNVEPIPELNIEEVEPWRKKFYAMCFNSTKPARLKRQKQLQPPLKCRYRLSKTVPYARYKEEVLSKSPYISHILDFISKNESETLKNETLSQLMDMPLPGIDPYVLWHYKGAYFGDRYSNSVGKISHRAGEVTGLDVFQKDVRRFVGEPIHVIDYGVSGLALPHNELEMFQSEPYLGRHRGKRYATLHVYLSDVAAGGATVFIEQNITVIPKQGAAVLWYNFKPSGEPEKSLLSATCPLAVGHNIVLEKGIWLQQNDPTSYCGLSSRSTFWTSDRFQSRHPALTR